jgi:hypothetical protein
LKENIRKKFNNLDSSELEREHTVKINHAVHSSRVFLETEILGLAGKLPEVIISRSLF